MHPFEPIIHTLSSELSIPLHSLVICGSMALAVQGLLDRKPRDIDLLVTQSSWRKLLDAPFLGKNGTINGRILTIKLQSGVNCDITPNWLELGYNVSSRIRKNAKEIRGILVSSPRDAMKFKMMLGRDHDRKDLEFAQYCQNFGYTLH